MLCLVFDLETVVLIFVYCIVLSSFVLFVCSVFPDKFHVRLSHDRIMELRNDIYMYVSPGRCTVGSLVGAVPRYTLTPHSTKERKENAVLIRFRNSVRGLLYETGVED